MYNEGIMEGFMTKYMKSRHIPLDKRENNSIDEGFEEFFAELFEIGSYLKTLREEKKLSEKAFCKKVGIALHHLKMIEMGVQPIFEDLAKKLGDLFNVDPKKFLMRV